MERALVAGLPTLPPVAPDRRRDPKVRKQMSGPAIRTFFHVAEAWSLSNEEQRALLGWPPESTFYKYKSGQGGTLSYDVLMRISLVLGIYKDLHILYPETDLADRWVQLPNSNPMFGGLAGAGTHDRGWNGRAVPDSPVAGRPPRRVELKLRNTCRLAPSIYPAAGILDRVASAEDLPFIFELESWTNDRISNELGILHRIPAEEWVVGRPMASVVMAAFCHPRPGGGRFNGPCRGAWYAGTELETAHAEVIYHRTRELLEVGVVEMRWQMRLYRADFDARFQDVRKKAALHDPDSYAASQAYARELLAAGSDGVLYRSVRRPGGECVACFRPALVLHVLAGCALRVLDGREGDGGAENVTAIPTSASNHAHSQPRRRPGHCRNKDRPRADPAATHESAWPIRAGLVANSCPGRRCRDRAGGCT